MNDVTATADTPRLVDQDNYFRDKMRANREGWKLAGCRTSSVIVPDEYRLYFTAMSSMLSAMQLLDILDLDKDQHIDMDLLDEFSNRRPKQTVTVEMLDELRDDNEENTEISTECDRLEMFLRQARLDRAKGREAAKGADAYAMMYHFSREYAQLLYVKGAYDYLTYLIGGGKALSLDTKPQPTKGKFDV